MSDFETKIAYTNGYHLGEQAINDREKIRTNLLSVLGNGTPVPVQADYVKKVCTAYGRAVPKEVLQESPETGDYISVFLMGLWNGLNK